MYSFQDVSVIVERFLAETKFCLAFYEVRKHVNVEGYGIKDDFFWPVTAETIGMHFPQFPLDFGDDDVVSHIKSDFECVVSLVLAATSNSLNFAVFLFQQKYP